MWRERWINIREWGLGKVDCTIFRNILPTGIDVRLDHDTSDGAVPGDQLLADGVNNLWLVEVVLQGVSVYTGMISGRRGSYTSNDVREQSTMMLGLY